MEVGSAIPRLADIGVESFMNFIIGDCSGCSATDTGAVRALPEAWAYQVFNFETKSVPAYVVAFRNGFIWKSD